MSEGKTTKIIDACADAVAAFCRANRELRPWAKPLSNAVKTAVSATVLTALEIQHGGDERPDYIKCIASAVTGNPLCGAPKGVFAWTFQGIDHAYENAINGGRLVACPECVASAAVAMALDDE